MDELLTHLSRYRVVALPALWGEDADGSVIGRVGPAESEGEGRSGWAALCADLERLDAVLGDLPERTRRAEEGDRQGAVGPGPATGRGLGAVIDLAAVRAERGQPPSDHS